MATYESKKYAIPGANITNIAATAVADGSVSDSEYQFINTLASNAQTQITARLPLAGGTMTGDLNLGDNVDINFGAGTDLKIFHDGSDSIIEDAGTGALELRASLLNVRNAADTQDMITATEGGAVSLFHNNSSKIATASGGVSITGTATATTFSGSGASLTNLNASNLASGTVPAARLPSTGKLLKVQTLVSGSNFDTTSVIAFDSSTPTSSEGIEVMSQSYTPVASDSQLLHVLSSAVTNASAGGTVIWSIFNGSTNIGAFANTTGSSGIWNQFTCQANEASSSSTSARTYSVRFGVPSSRGHWLQTNNYNYFLGAKAVYTIFEIAS